MIMGPAGPGRNSRGAAGAFFPARPGAVGNLVSARLSLYDAGNSLHPLAGQPTRAQGDAMPATIACPHCRTTHMYPDQMVGKRARCKQCLSLFLVSALTGVGTPVDDVDPHEQVQKETTKPKPAPPRRRPGDYGPEPGRKSGGSGML